MNEGTGGGAGPRLSGQQLDAMQSKIREAVTAAIARMELRKWAVEHATSLKMAPDVQLNDPIKFAREIHDFVIEPATVITIKIEQ